jgi:hypothetical protein
MLARNGSIASRKRYGDDDVKDDLKITIVRGISRQSPAAYAVMISQNPDNVPISEGSFIGFVSRINRMYPNSTQNLDRFLAERVTVGTCCFLPTC